MYGGVFANSQIGIFARERAEERDDFVGGFEAGLNV